MPIDKSKVRINHEPKMSLNALGEYLTVGPARRKSIIRDQKYQKTFITARYKEAEKAITNYLVGGCQDDQTLKDTVIRLLTADHESEWRRQAFNNCADAIDSFRDMAKDLPIKAVKATHAEASQPKISIAGVAVSVRPEILLRDKTGNIVGAIKLYFRKSKELSEKTGKLIATVLRTYLMDTFNAADTVKPAKCLVMDIFSGQIHQAPKAYKRAMANVQSACEEIAIRWPSVTL